jgi:hypothetical protein
MRVSKDEGGRNKRSFLLELRDALVWPEFANEDDADLEW